MIRGLSSKEPGEKKGKKVVIMIAIELAGKNSKQNNRCFPTTMLFSYLCLLTEVLFFV